MEEVTLSNKPGKAAGGLSYLGYLKLLLMKMKKGRNKQKHTFLLTMAVNFHVPQQK